MRKLLLWSQNHPLLIILLLAVISVGSFLNLKNLRVDTTADGMMVKGDPAKIVYNETLGKFGSDNITVVYVRDTELFTPEKLEQLQNLAYELEDVEGVTNVESLFSISSIRNEDGFLNSGPLMDWVPETLEEAQQVRKNALSNDILVENLISEAGDVTAINLLVEPRPDIPNFTTILSDSLESVIARYDESFDRVFQLGTPYNVRSQEQTINDDSEIIFPLSGLVIIVLLVISMRSLSAAFLPLLTAGFSILFTLGFMGFVDIPLSVLTFIVPSLLLVIGSTEDVHILSEYMEGMHLHGKRIDAIHYMASKVGTAIALTGITTVLGFLSISLNKVIVLHQFGLVAAFGLFVNPLVTALLAPVYLRYFGPGKARKQKHSEKGSFLDGVADGIASITQRFKYAIFFGVLLVTVVAIILGSGVIVDNNSIAFFKDDATIIQRINEMKESLAGSNSFYIRITGREGDFKKPEILQKIEDLRDFMNKRGWFDKTITFNDYMMLMNREMNQGNADFFTIPETEQVIDEYLLFLESEEVERYVTPDFDDLVILVRHNIYSASDLKNILIELREETDRVIPGHCNVEFTGEGILVNKAADTIAVGQVQGIGFVILVIFIIISLLFMNIKVGLLALIPNIFPIALNFAVMRLAGITLNTGTCMVAAIAVGIAVDDTIHFMSRYNKEMNSLQDQNKALQACLRAEILPVLSTTIALSVGFGVLTLSNFVPIMHFGFLSAMVIIFALLGDLFVTPVVLSFTQLISLWDMIELHLKTEVLTKSRLFENMRGWEIKKVILLGKMSNIEEDTYAVCHGDNGTTMFIILDGTATVFVTKSDSDEEFVLTTLGPGDIFGEIALVNPGPRTASIRTVTPVKCIELDWDGLERIRRFYPWLSSKLLLNISKILGERLATTDRLIINSHGDKSK
ncbi:MMPL family transporter [Candidatus Latescibacterota bacterium]